VSLKREHFKRYGGFLGSRQFLFRKTQALFLRDDQFDVTARQADIKKLAIVQSMQRFPRSACVQLRLDM
jgi:hypothetical protein